MTREKDEFSGDWSSDLGLNRSMVLCGKHREVVPWVSALWLCRERPEARTNSRNGYYWGSPCAGPTPAEELDRPVAMM
jgi:hypothetical protein